MMLVRGEYGLKLVLLAELFLGMMFILNSFAHFTVVVTVHLRKNVSF